MNKIKASKNYLKVLAVMGGLLIAASAFADVTCPPTHRHTNREHCRDHGSQNVLSKVFCKSSSNSSDVRNCKSEVQPVVNKYLTKVSLDDIKSSLVKPRNGVFVPETLPNTGIEYYAVYFSASWCEPCRNFTPELIKFYDSTKTLNSNFEVVFVSFDRSENEMLSYMLHADASNPKLEMHWPAVKYSAKDSLDVFKKCNINGIPTLLIFNRSGELISQSSSAWDVLEELKSVAR